MIANALQTQSPNLCISPIEDPRPTIQHNRRMDYEIQTDAERAIREDEVLCGMNDQVDVLVSAGIAYLSGYVATIAHKALAESEMSRVDGVEGVENNLYADEELRMLVSNELSRDADLSRHLLEVRSTQGFIRLDGHVASDDLAKTAVRLAGGIRGVRAVVNCLRWPGATADHAHERVLLPKPQALVTPDPSNLLPYGYLYREVLLESGGTNCQARRGQS